MPLSAASRRFRHPRQRLGLAVAGSALALVALAGCSPAPSPAATSSAPAATDGATSDPEVTPTPTATPEAPNTPVTLDCDQVLSPDDVYAFNPNFGTAPAYKPEGGSVAETAVKYDGVACGWSNQTSGEVIAVSVAQPSETRLTQLKDKAIAQSSPVPTYGTPPAIDGFFSATSGTGTAQVFSGAYWVTLSSVAFFEPGDVQQLAAAVVSHLP
ncbi:iron ABC transporter ATP-binding protein [Glaciibacter sp. 2TAF33]|uniref:iron ABC transporter ATP-binding protein n=1 Tax=Glaciibacter sp. 2TAF33 TaxID=3233015 RepID=UPI003F913D04